jgi:hypothetical protein
MRGLLRWPDQVAGADALVAVAKFFLLACWENVLQCKALLKRAMQIAGVEKIEEI